MKLLYLIITIVVTSFSCSPTYYNEGSFKSTAGQPPGEPGKCYAKCLVQDKSQDNTITVIEFTGEDIDQEGVSFREIILKEGGKKWEKKRADKNCHSVNPEDCLVWCLVDEPNESYTFYEVTDTTLVKDYKVTEVSKTSLVEKGGVSKWMEVICEKDIDKMLIMDIQEALVELDYTLDEVDGKFENSTKSALTNYQKDYGLAIGGLTIETMQSLRLSF